MLIVTGESTTGTADEAAAARDSGTALRSEQMTSKTRCVKTKREPVRISERAGTLMVGSGSPFPKGEESIARAALDTYAAARARNGDTVGSADSPYPISADADMRKWDGDSRTSV